MDSADTSDRYELGPTGDYGADGIPRDGMAERYATAMWRDNPAAFWLNPEGPLSDTTPDEYFVPRPHQTSLDMLNQQYAAQGWLNSYSQASAMTRHQYAGIRNAYDSYSLNGAMQLLGISR